MGHFDRGPVYKENTPFFSSFHNKRKPQVLVESARTWGG